MSRNKSILLQVAFKAAVDLGDVELTQAMYERLLGLHDSNGISLEDDAPRKGGYSPKPKATTREVSGTLFFDKEGNKWFDFRQAKADGKEKKEYPDFKSEDFKTSVWMYTRDGEPVEDAAPLVAAADMAAPL